jgi:glucose-6-phosphate 1-epimerase
MPNIQSLNDQHALAGALRFEAGQGQLVRAIIETPLARAELYLHGAHVTGFQPAGHDPVLFMSDSSWFEPGKPIRGGVPVVFPWFGPHPTDKTLPAHGAVRTKEWEVESTRQDLTGAVTIVLRLKLSEAQLRHHVTISDRLTLGLEVKNLTGSTFRYEAALHTYLAVHDVRQVSISGLGGTAYSDKMDGMRRKTQGDEPIRITAETDRIYHGTHSTCVVEDSGGRRRLIVEKSGSRSTVVWNPWIAKAKAMPDFGDDEWPCMLCIETANVTEDAISLQRDETHLLQAVIRAESA